MTFIKMNLVRKPFVRIIRGGRVVCCAFCRKLYLEKFKILKLRWNVRMSSTKRSGEIAQYTCRIACFSSACLYQPTALIYTCLRVCQSVPQTKHAVRCV